VYVIVWVFHPKPGREAEFERAYGPAGDWVALFRGAPGYLGTDLLRATDGTGRYLTADRWESRAAYEAFRVARRAEYEAVDRACEALTASEERVGDYLRIEPAPRPRPTSDRAGGGC
jgi:heme-degrading monooxygenase HmoA